MKRFTSCVPVWILVAACLCLAPWADAAVSAYVSTTYNRNLNDPPGTPTPDSPLRIYDADVNTWLLNSAHVAVKGGLTSEVEYVVEIDFGTDADSNSALSGMGTPYVDLQEAYIDTRSPESGLGIRAGKFATYMGIEVIESPENPTISRGFLYTYAVPLTHTGALLTYNGDQFDFAAGVVNGWDRVVDNNDAQTVLVKLGMEPTSDFGLVLSYLAGPEDLAGNFNRTSLDLTASVDAGRGIKFYIQYNTGAEQTAGADDTWSGFGVQAVFEPTGTFSLGLRYETFDDASGSRIPAPAAGGICSNLTIAPAFKLSRSTMIRFELRFDTADWNAFLDNTGAPIGTQTTAAVEVFAKF